MGILEALRGQKKKIFVDNCEDLIRENTLFIKFWAEQEETNKQNLSADNSLEHIYHFYC